MIESTAKQLSEIQANIIKPHARDYCWYLFFHIPNQQEEFAYESIRQAIEVFSCQITTGLSQVQQSINYEKYGIEGGVITCLFLSELGISKVKSGNNLVKISNLRSLRRELEVESGESTPWENHSKGEDSKTIDFVVMLADDHKEILSKYSEYVISFFEDTGKVNHLFSEKGSAIRKGKEYYEPFGFRDGLSKLPFWIKKNEELDPKIVSLIIDGNNGSFVVFQKLEQKVEAFHRCIYHITKMLYAQELSVLNKSEKENFIAEKKEFVYAQFVGRFRDGTPLIIASEPIMGSLKKNDPKVLQISQFNEYGITKSYQGGYMRHDPEGVKCPFFAHIRKTHFRDQSRNVENHWAPSVIPNKERPDRKLLDKIMKEEGLNEMDLPLILEKFEMLIERESEFNFKEEAQILFMKEAIQELSSTEAKYCSKFPEPETRIARRGIPYCQDGREKEEGLLFVSYQKNLCQFEIIEKWMRLSGFLLEDSGVDPIAGRPIGSTKTLEFEYVFKKEWGSKRLKDTQEIKIDIGKYVKYKGGEYFYAPSIFWMKNLH